MRALRFGDLNNLEYHQVINGGDHMTQKSRK